MMTPLNNRLTNTHSGTLRAPCRTAGAGVFANSSRALKTDVAAIETEGPPAFDVRTSTGAPSATTTARTPVK
jgi:hypothetical protein